MGRLALRFALIYTCLISVTLLFGCGLFEGYEKSHDKRVFLINEELQEADRVMEKAHKEGKDIECPREFYILKEMKDKAYQMYWACRTSESLEMAREVIERAKKLCPPSDAIMPAPLSFPPPSPQLLPPSPPTPLKFIKRITLKAEFDFNKAIIREKDKKTLMKTVEHMNEYPNSRIIIEGHTCSIGSNTYNQNLSQRRATSVKRFLIEEGGINETKFVTIGYGEFRPLFSNRTSEGRAKNRRIEIIIIQE